MVVQWVRQAHKGRPVPRAIRAHKAPSVHRERQAIRVHKVSKAIPAPALAFQDHKVRWVLRAIQAIRVHKEPRAYKATRVHPAVQVPLAHRAPKVRKGTPA